MMALTQPLSLLVYHKGLSTLIQSHDSAANQYWSRGSVRHVCVFKTYSENFFRKIVHFLNFIASGSNTSMIICDLFKYIRQILHREETMA